MGDEPSDSHAMGIRLAFRRRPAPGPLRSVIRAPSRLGAFLAALSGAAAIAALGLVLLASREGNERPPIRSTLTDPAYAAPIAAAVPEKAVTPVAAPTATPPVRQDIAQPAPSPKVEAQARAAAPPVLTLDLLPVLSREAAEMDYSAPAEPKPRRAAPQR